MLPLGRQLAGGNVSGDLHLVMWFREGKRGEGGNGSRSGDVFVEMANLLYRKRVQIRAIKGSQTGIASSSDLA